MQQRHIELGVVIVFVAIFLTLIGGNLLDKKIVHQYPYGYMAADAFFHQFNSEWTKTAGNYKFAPPAIANGLENVPAYIPPHLYHNVALFSTITGIEVYDSIYLMVLLLVILSVLAFYLALRKFSPQLAILSLPFVLMFAFTTSMTSITFGQWIYISGAIYLATVFFFLGHLEGKWLFVPLAIILAAAIMSHTSEFIFAILVLGLIFLINSLKWKAHKVYLINILLAVGLSIVLGSYYLMVFFKGFAKFSSYKLAWSTSFDWNNGLTIVKLPEFGWLLLPVGLGIIFYFILKNKPREIFFGSIALFLVGLGNYIGLANRAFQTRFFWPIYLSVFFALGMYGVISLVAKKNRFLISLGVSFLTILVILFTNSAVESSPGIMDPYHWDAFNWIRENVPVDEPIYMQFSYAYGQKSNIYNTMHVAYIVPYTYIVNMLNSGNISFTMDYQFLFTESYLFYMENKGEKVNPNFKKNICDIKYHVIDIEPGQDGIIGFNRFLRGKLLENEWIKEIYNNGVVSVIVNGNPGAECIRTE